MMKRLICTFALACSTALPLSAGNSFDMPVTGEVLPGWQQADGTRIAALRLSLAPGWKTYWRTPGDAGIPPEISWTGSKNLHSAGITWPTPEVFKTSGMRTIGYSGDLVLPVALAPRDAGKPIKLHAVLDIGVCSDICVPHRMTLTALIDDASTTPTPAIAAALAARPLSQKEAGVRSVTCALTPIEDGMQIEARVAMPSAGGGEVVIIEPGHSGLWSSETEVTRHGSTLVAIGEITSSNGPVALQRSDIRITVLGQKHSVDIKGCAAG